MEELNEETNMNVLKNLEYAGFWMRFWAYLFDLTVIFSINGLIVKPLFRIIGFALDKSLFSPYSIITALVFYAYFILMTKFTQQTLGKMVFGIRVVPLKSEYLSWDTVIFREGVGRYISVTFIVLYAIVAFTPKKQGLHDLFADTAVIYERTNNRLVYSKPIHNG